MAGVLLCQRSAHILQIQCDRKIEVVLERSVCVIDEIPKYLRVL